MQASRSIRRWAAAAAAVAATTATLAAAPAGVAQAVPPQAGCFTADYQLVAAWGSSFGRSGFAANVYLANDCSTTVSDWTVVLPYGGADVDLMPDWSGIWRQEGNRLIAESPETWNGAIAPGGSLYAGFAADGNYYYPTDCTVNGQSCEPLD